MTDHLLLIGEPCPLLGRLNMRLIELVGCLPPGNSDHANSIYRLAAITLEATILSVIDRLKGFTDEHNSLELRTKAIASIQSATDCIKVTEPITVPERCTAFFNILGVVMTQLKDITGTEYPRLTDGEGKVIGN